MFADLLISTKIRPISKISVLSPLKSIIDLYVEGVGYAGEAVVVGTGFYDAGSDVLREINSLVDSIASEDAACIQVNYESAAHRHGLLTVIARAG